VAKYDAGDVVNDTNGKNILRWMVEDLGFEVDPHAHETTYNYADVVYLITQLGITPSKNVGGFLYNPTDNLQGWEKHMPGIYGLQYPSFYWRADNLWGASTYNHIGGGDDCSFGVWQPQDKFNFYKHSAGQRLLYIGGGCGGLYGIQDVINAKDNGNLDPGGFYTASVFISQEFITLDTVRLVSASLDAMNPDIIKGRIMWKSLTQTADIWRARFSGKPFQVVCNPIPEGMVLDNSAEPCPLMPSN
jgi:hypothetical protein